MYLTQAQHFFTNQQHIISTEGIMAKAQPASRKGKTPAAEEAARQHVVGPRGKKLVDAPRDVEFHAESHVESHVEGGQDEDHVVNRDASPIYQPEAVAHFEGGAIEQAEAEHEERRAAEAPGRRGDDVMNFAASQLTAPAAHVPELSEEDKKQVDFLAQVAKLASEMGVTLPQFAKTKAKADRAQNNNITKPADGTTTGSVWAAADEITAQTGSPASIAALKQHKAMRDVNLHTIKTQYARWRAYHGITGRVVQVIIKEVPSTAEELKEAQPD
jgi:hypothetical protein